MLTKDRDIECDTVKITFHGWRLTNGKSNKGKLNVGGANRGNNTLTLLIIVVIVRDCFYLLDLQIRTHQRNVSKVLLSAVKGDLLASCIAERLNCLLLHCSAAESDRGCERRLSGCRLLCEGSGAGFRGRYVGIFSSGADSRPPITAICRHIGWIRGSHSRFQLCEAA